MNFVWSEEMSILKSILQKKPRPQILISYQQTVSGYKAGSGHITGSCQFHSLATRHGKGTHRQTIFILRIPNKLNSIKFNVTFHTGYQNNLSCCKNRTGHLKTPTCAPQCSIWAINLTNITGIGCRNLSTSFTNNVGYKLKNNIRDCYSLFNLPPDCSEEELRDAYLRLAKQYHPDSGTSTACPRKFRQIQEAYVTIRDYVSQQNTDISPNDHEYNEDEEDEFDFPYTLPQHRQYLGNEGVGFGTPNQRQNQYDKYKVRRAADVVYEFRMNKNISGSEEALVVMNKREARKKKISNTIDRIVEDLIQESMSKGEFENLPGKGKPLNYNERNPLVDTVTHNINKILINNGYAPEWITLEKEIRVDTQKARQRLAVERNRLGDFPLSGKDLSRWKHHLKIFENAILDLNEKIMRFNMIVPSSLIQKQRIPYRLEREIQRVSEKYLEYLPPETETIIDTKVMDNYISTKQTDKVEWSELWENIKDSFKSIKSDNVKK